MTDIVILLLIAKSDYYELEYYVLIIIIIHLHCDSIDLRFGSLNERVLSAELFDYMALSKQRKNEEKTLRGSIS